MKPELDPQNESVDRYIQAFPKDIRSILEKMRQTVREAAPQALETMSYGIPTFKLNGRSLVHFAAFKNHIGFYPTPAAIVAFRKELSSFQQSKGAVQFPIERVIPFDLVKRIVIFRVEENLGI